MAEPRVVEFNGSQQVFPADATDEEIAAALEQLAPGTPSSPAQLSPAPAAPAAPTTPEREPYGAKDLLAPWDVGLHTATGMLATPVAGLAGIADLFGQALDPYNRRVAASQGQKWQDTPPADEVINKVMEAMTYQPRTQLGKDLTGVQESIMGLPAKGANFVGEKTTDAISEAIGGGPIAATAGATVNTGLQALPAILLDRFANPPKAVANARAVKEMRAKINNAPDDAVVRSAQKLDIPIMPADANPTAFNKAMEAVSDRSGLANRLSEKAEPAVEKIAKESIGLGDTVPLSEPYIDQVIKQNGKHYEAVAELPDTFHVTDAFQSKIKDMGGKYAGKADKVVSDLKEELSQLQEMSPKEAIERLKDYREEVRRANKAQQLSPDEARRASAYRDAATATEELIEDNLKHLDREDLYDNFVKARKLIARSYDIKDSFVDGRFSARKFARRTKGVNMDDPNLKTLQQVGERFKDSVKVRAQRKGPSYWLLEKLFRLPTQSVVASDWYQKTFAQPPTRNLPTTDLRKSLSDGQIAEIAAALEAQQDAERRRKLAESRP